MKPLPNPRTSSDRLGKSADLIWSTSPMRLDCPRLIRARRRRPGMILLVVIILLALMSLAAVGSVALMQIENTASHMRGDELILENTAISAGEWLSAISRQSREVRTEILRQSENGELFRHQSFGSLPVDDDTPFYAMLTTSSGGNDTAEIQYGYTNESAKIHLQMLLDWEKQWPGSAQQALMQLPGMTPAIADKILDWIDADSEPRMLGAEQDKYAAQQLGYSPRNAVPNTLDELLFVPGVTRRDLFGDETAAESDLTGNSDFRASDRSSQQSHRPWSEFLTVQSGERNEASDGQPRVFLNSPDLPELHQQLEARLGLAWADYIVAYRQFGPSRSSRGTEVARFEPDFSQGPSHEITSELDLVGSKVAVARSGRSVQLLSSPLSNQRSSWMGELSKVMDQISVTAQPQLLGRINIDQAGREVLMAIPELDPATVDQILAARALSNNSETGHEHSTWLVEQGFVDLKRMRTILPFVTTGGDIFQAEIIAYFTNRSLIVRNLVMVDGVRSEGHQLYWKDMRDLPLRFPREDLFMTKQPKR